jgi:2'-hydroxyisoflavone reductase
MSNILILGGTQFLGRSFVEELECSQNTKKITLCNRGVSNPELFSNLNKIKCDRNLEKDCQIIFNDFYDFVFDFSGYKVIQLSNISKYLRCHKYIYISTISVLHEYADEVMKSYAYNKSLCEKFVNEIYKNNCIVRPTCVIGDNDNTNRFYKENEQYYWTSSKKKVTECITPGDLNKVLINEINFSNGQKVISCEK